MMQPHCLIDKRSVSPHVSYHVAPVFGASSSHQEEPDALGEERQQASAIPGGVAGEDEERRVREERVEEEEGESETRKPRVGRRPVAPTQAEIDEHYPLHCHESLVLQDLSLVATLFETKP